jgi:hypothetical protein
MDGNMGTPVDGLRQFPQQQYQQQGMQPPISQQQMMQQQIPPQIMMQQPNMFPPQQQMGDMNIPNIDLNDLPPMPMPPPRIQPKHIKKSGTKFPPFEKIPQAFRAPLILVVLFIIMSLDVVKQTIGAYIPQIRPNTTGNVSLIGYGVYGIILAIAFETLKNMLL